MSLVPNHRERQMMQRLRGRGWVKARELPENPVTMQRLLERRWIESQGTGRDIAYRLTEEGMAAKKAPVRLY
jgi:chromosome segregation and condensation protein ScpB